MFCIGLWWQREKLAPALGQSPSLLPSPIPRGTKGPCIPLCGLLKPHSSSSHTSSLPSDSSTWASFGQAQSIFWRWIQGRVPAGSGPFGQGPDLWSRREGATPDKECSQGKTRGAPPKAQDPGRGLLAQVYCSTQRCVMSSQPTSHFRLSPVDSSMEAQTFLVLPA